MLTDTKLRNLKPRDKLYKENDRDGLYVAVTPAGVISFRYNYSIHGRQETITFGRYCVGGITLWEARERLVDRSINTVTFQLTPRSNLFQRNTTGAALNSAMPLRMRSLSSSVDLTRMCRRNVRAILEKAHSIRLSQEACLGV